MVVSWVSKSHLDSAFYGDHGLHETYTGVVLDPEEGKRIGAALGDYKAVILRNHGMLTVGRSVESAAWWFLTLDSSGPRSRS